MSEIADSPVFVPTTLAEAIQIVKRNPRIPLWAGGTWWAQGRSTPEQDDDQLEGPHGAILTLHAIRELKRVVRSEIHVDVGAAVVVARLREAGSRFLPPVLLRALERTGPPPVRNLATLGGAVCIPDQILPVTLVLQLLDTRLDLRRGGRGHTLALANFRPNPGDILTRLRIPLTEWSNWSLNSFGTIWPRGDNSLTVAAVAHVEKGSVQEFRLGLLINGETILRLREAEMDILGRPVPLTERDQRIILTPLQQHPLYGSHLDDLGRWRATGAVRQFLRRLG